jgi:hypothetical protein
VSVTLAGAAAWLMRMKYVSNNHAALPSANRQCVPAVDPGDAWPIVQFVPA